MAGFRLGLLSPTPALDSSWERNLQHMTSKSEGGRLVLSVSGLSANRP